VQHCKTENAVPFQKVLERGFTALHSYTSVKIYHKNKLCVIFKGIQ